MADFADTIAAALQDELGWEWEAEDHGDTCSHGGPIRVPSSTEIISDIASAVTGAIRSKFRLIPLDDVFASGGQLHQMDPYPSISVSHRHNPGGIS